MVFLLMFLLCVPVQAGKNKIIGPGVVTFGSGCTIQEGDTLTLRPGSIVKVGSEQSIYVHGCLICLGTRRQPIYFTSVLDDSKGGDTDGDGGMDMPLPGEWGPMLFGDSSEVFLSYCWFGYLALPFKVLSKKAICDNLVFHQCNFDYVIGVDKKLSLKDAPITYHYDAKTLISTQKPKGSRDKPLLPMRSYVLSAVAVGAIATGATMIAASFEAKEQYDHYAPGNPDFDSASVTVRAETFNRYRTKYITRAAVGVPLLLLGLGNAAYVVWYSFSF